MKKAQTNKQTNKKNKTKQNKQTNKTKQNKTNKQNSAFAKISTYEKS